MEWRDEELAGVGIHRSGFRCGSTNSSPVVPLDGIRFHEVCDVRDHLNSTISSGDYTRCDWRDEKEEQGAFICRCDDRDRSSAMAYCVELRDN